MSDPPSDENSTDSGDDGGFDPELRRHLLDDIDRDQQRFRFERRVQYALIGFGVALMVILCLAIWASTIRARVVITVYGDGRGGDGQPSALRVVARDPKIGEVLRPRHAEIRLLVPGQGATPVENVVLGPETVDAALFADPRAVAAGASLVVEVATDDLQDQLQVPLTAPVAPALGVRLVDAVEALEKPKEATGAIDRPARFPRFPLQQGSAQLRLYPESGTLVPVLGNDVWLLALHRGRPYPGLRMRVEPPGWTLETDAMGLAQLRLTPGRELGALKIKRVIAAAEPGAEPGAAEGEAASQPAGDGAALAPSSAPADEDDGVQIESGWARATLDTPPAQLLARTRQVLVAPGGDMQVDVHSVRLRTWLSMEVWYGERLVAMSYTRVEDGQAQLELPAPDRARTVAAVRLARSPVREDVVSDTAFFYIDDAPPRDAWRHLLQDLGAELQNDPGLAALSTLAPASDEIADQLMRIVLSRAQLKMAAPPQLADSSARNHAQADAARARWQRWLFAGYWFLGLGALALAVIAVLLHNRRVYLSLAAFQAEQPDEEDETAAAMRRRGTFELVGVVVGMTFGLFILYYLLANLWWG